MIYYSSCSRFAVARRLPGPLPPPPTWSLSHGTRSTFAETRSVSDITRASVTDTRDTLYGTPDINRTRRALCRAATRRIIDAVKSYGRPKLRSATSLKLAHKRRRKFENQRQLHVPPSGYLHSDATPCAPSFDNV